MKTVNILSITGIDQNLQRSAFIMGIKGAKDVQLSFEFDTGNQKIIFIRVKGLCRCGYSGEFSKADVVLEMTVPCPKCGSLISMK